MMHKKSNENNLVKLAIRLKLGNVINHNIAVSVYVVINTRQAGRHTRWASARKSFDKQLVC